MSRKQEIYRDLLRWALPSSRNNLSRFKRVRPLLFLTAKQQRTLRAAYEIAQFVHNITHSILEEEFTEHDFHVLNVHARAFIEGNNDQNCYHYSMFAYYIQELFKAVPEEMRNELKWNGPEGDYSFARPRRGYEM